MKDQSWEERLELQHDAARHGLKGDAGKLGKTLDVTRELVGIAAEGLRDPARPLAFDGEEKHLEPLQEILTKGSSPAAHVLDLWSRCSGEEKLFLDQLTQT